MVQILNPTHVTFQPEWTQRDFIQDMIELVKKDQINVRVILQQHKYIWGEKRGV